MQLTVERFFMIVAVVVIGWHVMSPNTTVNRVSSSVITRDSVVYRTDTLRDTIKLPSKVIYNIRTDTIVYNDTIFVPLPISRYTFQDSTYCFVVEGFNVKPISFETYNTTRTIFRERTETKVINRRFSWGLSVGFGGIYGTKGVDFGIIYGVTFNIKLIK